MGKKRFPSDAVVLQWWVCWRLICRLVLVLRSRVTQLVPLTIWKANRAEMCKLAALVCAAAFVEAQAERLVPMALREEPRHPNILFGVVRILHGPLLTSWPHVHVLLSGSCRLCVPTAVTCAVASLLAAFSASHVRRRLLQIHAGCVTCKDSGISSGMEDSVTGVFSKVRSGKLSDHHHPPIPPSPNEPNDHE